MKRAVLALLLFLPSPADAGWRADSYTDKLDGKTDEYAFLLASETVLYPQNRSPERDRHGELQVRCIKGHETRVHVAVLRSLINGENATMEYRLDNEAPVTARGWRASTDYSGRALVGSKAAEGFVKRLLKAKTLFVRFTDNVFGQSEITFDLAGMDKAIAPVRAACKW